MTATEEFAFLLAREFGEEDPYAMMERMPAKTFNAWRQFWRSDPFGAEADWLRNGILAATVANSAPFRGKDSKVASPSDFMPPDPDKKPTGLAAMSESDRIMLMARFAGAKVRRLGIAGQT